MFQGVFQGVRLSVAGFKTSDFAKEKLEGLP